MVTLQDIILSISRYYPDADTALVRKAHDFSLKLHRGQRRKSGEPYINHPLEVAKILTELKLDIPSIATAILHDTVEDTVATIDEIRAEFGNDVSALVDGVTKLSQITFKNAEEKQAENFRKMIMAMAKDLRVILVKLADRLHNMRTLQYLPVMRRIAIARETLDVYAPLANRLGMSEIKGELEDLSLRYLKPEIYYRLVKKVAKKKKKREKYIEEVIQILHSKLNEFSIKGDVYGRPKHFYSIYKKMEANDIDYDQVYDITAFRIMVKSISECYEVLGIVHSFWKPVPGRFKDYIAMPKANMYQSLHTTVIGPYGEKVEIQIRTSEMHNIAERGIAAHWLYKDGNMSKEDAQRFHWLRNLLEWQKDVDDPAEFLETVRLDLFAGDIYVFTPAGELKEFPYGSTPVDFAYAIHTEIGHHCVGAKINGKIVPLKTRLKSGDTVEILTSPAQNPSKDWLKLVKTSRAKAKIRSFIAAQEKEQSRTLGKEMLEKGFKKEGRNLNKFIKEGKLEKVAKDEFGCQNIEDLMISVGYGKIPPVKVLQAAFPEAIDDKKTEEDAAAAIKDLMKPKKKSKQKDTAIKVRGIDDILVRFAKCCTPVPGDGIVGFITRGRGVVIHTVDCPKMLDADPERKIDVEWDKNTQTERVVRIQVVTMDEPGILMDVSKVLVHHGVNIAQTHMRTTKDGRAVGFFDITVKDTEHLQRVIQDLEGIAGINSVERLKN